MRTDRKKDLDMYYNDHLKMHIVHRLMQVKSWSEIKGIQSAVFEALDRENKAEQQEKAAFQHWKDTNEQAPRPTNGPGFPGPCQMARGPGPELQGTSDRMQGSGRKLDKIKL